MATAPEAVVGALTTRASLEFRGRQPEQVRVTFMRRDPQASSKPLQLRCQLLCDYLFKPTGKDTLVEVQIPQSQPADRFFAARVDALASDSKLVYSTQVERLDVRGSGRDPVHRAGCGPFQQCPRGARAHPVPVAPRRALTQAGHRVLLPLWSQPNHHSHHLRPSHGPTR
jgi:hypothetical protein